MSCDKSWNESNLESSEQKDNEQARKMSARNINAQQTQQHLAAPSKFNLSAKEFVSRASAHTSPSSLAPAMTGLNMMPSPTFTSQSWIVDNLRSLISNQDDDACESENEMASLNGSKAYKAKAGRSPMHSIGNFEIDEIEQARRDRFEGRASQMQYQSQSAFRSAAGGQGKEFRSFGGMRNDEDYENQNSMAYNFESSGAYLEERFPPKRPFSPDEIHELTPYQQLQYQIQQQQQNNLLFMKSQQSKEKATMRPNMNDQDGYHFQNADGLDFDNDVNMLNEFGGRGGGQFGPSCFGDMAGFDNGQMRKNMFRSSSSSKLLPNKSSVVRLNERKQRSLMRLTSEMPTGLSVGQMEPMSHQHSFQSSGRLPNKSPSDNNLLAYFKQFNQPSSVSEQFNQSRGASFACPNIFVSQASSGLSGSMGEFVPKNVRVDAQMKGGSKMLKVDSAEMAHSRCHDFNMDGSNDFNNSSMCEFDAQQSECSFNGSSAFASRRNYPQFLSQRMQSSRHSLQMSDLRAHQMSLQQSQPRYSMVSQHLEPESAFGAQGQQHGLKKMAKSSSSLVYQENNQSFSGINSRYGHMNDSEMSLMSIGGNQDDSLLVHHSSQKWMNNGGGGKKWMLNQATQQQYQMQQQQHQLMNQQAANVSRDGFRSSMMIEDEEGQAQSQDQKEPIILHVKNLDYKISADEWKRILLENFRKHCKEIISVSVATNADKSLLGIVKLGTKEDTRLAISCLHHKKIGYKRLNVEIASSSGSNSPK